MTASRSVLVIGGTQFIGRELVRRLLARGDHVAILHRGRSQIPPEASEILCDRNDTGAVRRALAGRRFDLVFDNVYDIERGTTATQVQAAAEACAGHVRRYVFMSSVAVYPEGLDWEEDARLVSVGQSSEYAVNKAESEQMLFRMHREREFPAVTLRPPFIYGPENPYYRESFFWDRIVRGRPVLIPEDGARLMQFVYVKDLVWAALKAAEAPVAPGQAYNIANATPVTQVEGVRALAAAAGLPAGLVFVPRQRIAAAGGNVFQPPFYFGEYLDLPSITVSIAKARRELGFEPTAFAAGLRETYQWYVAQKRPEPDFSWEDRLLKNCTTG